MSVNERYEKWAKLFTTLLFITLSFITLDVFHILKHISVIQCEVRVHINHIFIKSEKGYYK